MIKNTGSAILSDFVVFYPPLTFRNQMNENCIALDFIPHLVLLKL